MKLNEIIEGLQDELSSFSFSEETRFNEDAYWWNLIAEKRAIAIKESYDRNTVINPAVVQDMGKMRTTSVNFDDDLGSGCNAVIGKIRIPQIVHIKDNMMRDNDLGVYKILSECQSRQYHKTTLDLFNEIVLLGGPRSKLDYYFRLGEFVYVYPYIEEVRPRLILNDPLEGFIIREYDVLKSDMIIGEIYKITEGKVNFKETAGGVLTDYYKGETFTANQAIIESITGTGKIRHNEEKKRLEPSDQYPISGDMMESIRTLIRQDFAFSNRSQPDQVNDSADEKNLQQSG